MARNNFTLTTSTAAALAAATAKTVLQLTGAAGIITAIQSLIVSFDGAVSTNVPVIIVLRRQTTAGTMTSRAPLKTKDTSTALQCTGQENATAEPTASDILAIFYLHPQTGVVYPLTLPDGEIELASATRVGIVVTAPNAVNCLVTLGGEE